MKEAFLREVRALLGEAAVKTAASDLEPYAIDWRKRYVGKPLAALLPESSQQLAGIVRLARQHQAALVPQGGNTGLSGGATPDASGSQTIVLVSRLNKILSLDAANHTITVQAGVTLAQVREAAEQAGLFFPLGLGSEGSATIGGVLSTNAGGTAVLRYGNARELCLGLEVVTAAGEIWNGLRGLRKDNSGYDLRDLYIGSEGTLGMITAAVLKLFPKPAAVVTALVKVANPAAALALLAIAQRRCDAMLTGFEYMSSASTRLLAQYLPNVADHGRQIFGDTGSDSVLIEISHPESEAAATAMLEDVMAKAIDSAAAQDAIVAQSLTQARELWKIREEITLAAAADGPHIKHDIALPVSRLDEFIAAMDRELLASYAGLRIINFGHFGDGNLHYNVAPPLPAAVDATSADARRAAYTKFLSTQEDGIRRRVHDRVMSMNGSISAEHGLGQLRKDDAARYKSPVEINLMRAIKKALDPNGIMNPGKVL